jgi:nitroimidazol reductase NimA-like FMN-containing flavoprotein (pyridoxamine 5'-phosphate oxidase superfamily)
MELIDQHSGLRMLDRDDCMRLLAASELGRLAVSVGTTPHIFPVNYRLVGEVIAIRTDEGTKLRAVGGRAACFEIDGADRLRRTGWSVVVSGRLEELTPLDGARWRMITAADVDPWAGGEKAHWLCLHLEHVTGRRIGDLDA